MCDCSEVCKYLEISVKDWHFTSTISFSNLKGFISRCRDNVTLLNMFAVPSGLLLEVRSMGLNQSFKILSSYGPYEDKLNLWGKLFMLMRYMILILL